ncbi:MAG: tubulin/FtsZ family protein [Halodesulfurarchaeum sp.]
MKVALIGLGQAGGKVAQALRDTDEKAGYGAIRGTLAVNTASADLEPLSVETLLIGQERVSGHGVGADNELGASIMQNDVQEVMTALDGVIDPATEAIVLVAALGGGTGSGGAPVLARELRRVYEIPVYGLGILPGRDEGAIYQANAGRSLKTFVNESDALILVDNDAWRSSGETVSESFESINETIARRISLLLAAGENVEGVGEAVVDSSEVINTLRTGGMAAIGYASAEASPDAEDNINVVTSTARRAMMTQMSLPETTVADAGLVIVAGEPDRISRKGVERARKWIEEEAQSMQVRGGDFPLETDRLAVVILLSGIAGSPRLEEFMDRAAEASKTIDREDPVDAFDTDELEDLM